MDRRERGPSGQPDTAPLATTPRSRAISAPRFLSPNLQFSIKNPCSSRATGFRSKALLLLSCWKKTKMVHLTQNTPRAYRAIFLAALLALAAICDSPLGAQLDAPTRPLSRDIFKQLIEINTTDSIGSTTVAAKAMAERLRAAGFPASDAQVLGPNDRKGNLVARLRGSGAHRPILLIGHLDVVEARREDWSIDPFQFIEKDGYFYGRGTQDMKSGDAILVTTLIRLKKENYRPDRDIILALTADEEGGKSNGVDWLLKNHRDLIDAEFALNADGGGIYTRDGKPAIVTVDASEKLYADYQLEVKNPGGHSSLPVPDNAIYHLTDALGRLERYKFPFELNAVTRAFFERSARRGKGPELRRHEGHPEESAERGGDCAPIKRSALQRHDAHHLRRHAARCGPCQQRPAANGARHRELPHPAGTHARRSPPRPHQDSGRSGNRGPLCLGFGRNFRFSSGTARFAAGHDSPRSDAAPRENCAGDVAGAPVIPTMATGASDGVFTNAAGMPTYGISGIAIEFGDVRAHGRDERVGIASYYDAVDFYYRYLKALTSPD